MCNKMCNAKNFVQQNFSLLVANGAARFPAHVSESFAAQTRLPSTHRHGLGHSAADVAMGIVEPRKVSGPENPMRHSLSGLARRTRLFVPGTRQVGPCIPRGIAFREWHLD